MVKDISNQTVNYKIGLVSLSVDELIYILEQKGVENVSARNNNLAFESLDDIKANKGLFAGQPTVYLDKARITLERNWCTVSSSIKGAEDTSFAKSIYEDLLRHRSALDNFVSWPIFAPYIMFPILLFGFVSSELYRSIGFSDRTISLISSAFVVYTVGMCAKFLWEFYSYLFRQVVYYRPTRGFFSRNIETILVSAITGIIGVLIGSVGPTVVERIKSLF